jgi:hypothetical protein
MVAKLPEGTPIGLQKDNSGYAAIAELTCAGISISGITSTFLDCAYFTISLFVLA